MTGDVLDVLCPPAVVGDRINTKSDHFGAPRRELLIECRDGAQLSGADRGEILGMREEHRPVITDPFVKLDGAVSGFSSEVGCDIVNAK